MARDYPKFLGAVTGLRAELVIQAELRRLLEAAGRNTTRATVAAENLLLLAEVNALLPAEEQFDADVFRASLSAGPTDVERSKMLAEQDARYPGEVTGLKTP